MRFAKRTSRNNVIDKSLFAEHNVNPILLERQIKDVIQYKIGTFGHLTQLLMTKALAVDGSVI